MKIKKKSGITKQGKKYGGKIKSFQKKREEQNS